MFAVAWRELKVTTSSPAVLVFHLLTPLFMLVFFASVLANNLAAFSYHGMQVNYLDYFTPGLAGYVTFMSFQLALTFVRREKVSGLLSLTAIARGSLVGYVTGKLTMQTALNLAKVAILLSVALLMSSGTVNLLRLPNLLSFVLNFIMGSMIWLALGISLAMVIKREDIRDLTLMLITLPLVFSSSMYYDISRAPGWIQAISRVNPLTYCCNLLRQAYFLERVEFLSTDELLLCLWFVVASALVLVATRRGHL